MKNKFRKILILLFSLPILGSCSNDNQIISGDFTIGEAKKYANDYLKLVKNKDSLAGHEINVFLNLGRYNDNKGIILLIDYRPIDMREGMECDYFEEKIGDYVFDWDLQHLLEFSCEAARLYQNDKVYTLTEAYQEKILNINDIKKAKEKLSRFNSVDGVLVNYKFTNKID